MNQCYKTLNKAPWTPPNYVFGIVWSILYIMMGSAFIIVWNNPQCFPFCNPLLTFIIQLGFNLIWTTLFFKMQMPIASLFDIILIIIFTIFTYVQFLPISQLASYLLIPYILWLLLAFSLNLYIVIFN